jgi:drug/metabolite transporter (DMT)-like permease
MSWCWFGTFFSFILLFAYRLDIKEESKQIGFRYIGKFVFLIICVGTVQLMTNYAFKHMSVGYALSLFQLSAIVSVLLGYRFFKERDIGKKLFGSAIMIIGSIIIILATNK